MQKPSLTHVPLNQENPETKHLTHSKKKQNLKPSLTYKTLLKPNKQSSENEKPQHHQQTQRKAKQKIFWNPKFEIQIRVFGFRFVEEGLGIWIKERRGFRMMPFSYRKLTRIQRRWHKTIENHLVKERKESLSDPCDDSVRPFDPCNVARSKPSNLHTLTLISWPEPVDLCFSYFQTRENSKKI